MKINVNNYACLHCFHRFSTLENTKEILKCPKCGSTNVSNQEFGYTSITDKYTLADRMNASLRW